MGDNRTVVLTVAALCGVATILYARVKLKGQQHESYGDASTAELKLRCGTRKSALAMVQTRWACSQLAKLARGVYVDVLAGVNTKADNVLDVSLKSLVQTQAAKGNGAGLFTKELEDGLQGKVYDFAVHSLKDVPTTLPEGLTIAAIGEREDPRDCVVFRKKSGITCLRDLPKGSVIGTSSVRREAILNRDYPGFKIKLIRGNVNTRLAKLEAGEYDAILLAYAGMKRLGFDKLVGQILDPNEFPYGVSQGSLGIECRESDEDIKNALKVLGHPQSSARCRAERALLRELEGGCQVPLGVHTNVFFSPARGIDWLEISCQILTLDGRITVSGNISGPAGECELLGVRLAVRLREEAGGKHIISPEEWENFENVNKKVKRPLTYGDAENPNRNNA